MKGKIMNLFVTGGIAGGATYFILPWVSKILAWAGQYTPTVTAKLANPALEINVGQSVGLETGLGTTGLGDKAVGWLSNALGFTVPTNTMTDVALAIIGGGLLFILGGYIAELVNYLGAKTSLGKTAVTILAGNLAAGIILGTVALSSITLSVTFANVLIAMLINAGILALILSLVEPYIRKVLPF
jgi:hypothetical protein